MLAAFDKQPSSYSQRPILPSPPCRSTLTDGGGGDAVCRHRRSSHSSSAEKVHSAHHLESGLQSVHVHRLQHRLLHQKGLRRPRHPNHARTHHCHCHRRCQEAAAATTHHQPRQAHGGPPMSSRGTLGRRLFRLSLLAGGRPHLRRRHVQTRWRRRRQRRRRSRRRRRRRRRGRRRGGGSVGGDGRVASRVGARDQG